MSANDNTTPMLRLWVPRDSAALAVGADTVADASLAWHFAKKTTFRLLGRNLTDKVYANNTYNGNQFVLGEPRRFDLVAEMKF